MGYVCIDLQYQFLQDVVHPLSKSHMENGYCITYRSNKHKTKKHQRWSKKHKTKETSAMIFVFLSLSLSLLWGRKSSYRPTILPGISEVLVDLKLYFWKDPCCESLWFYSRSRERLGDKPSQRVLYRQLFGLSQPLFHGFSNAFNGITEYNTSSFTQMYARTCIRKRF